MIGCGFPDRHADALTENLSLIAALRAHVCRGHRIYSEGGGTAYLGRTMILGDRRVPGAGILPFDAELRTIPRLPTPVTRTLTRDGWLGPKGTIVRGYKSGRWRLLPGADPLDCPSCFGTLTTQGDISYHHHAIGSLVHLHLGALPEVVAAFAGPHRASLTPAVRPPLTGSAPNGGEPERTAPPSSGSANLLDSLPLRFDHGLGRGVFQTASHGDQHGPPLGAVRRGVGPAHSCGR